MITYLLWLTCMIGLIWTYAIIMYGIVEHAYDNMSLNSVLINNHHFIIPQKTYFPRLMYCLLLYVLFTAFPTTI
mgnify:CR=1 FL=1